MDAPEQKWPTTSTAFCCTNSLATGEAFCGSQPSSPTAILSFLPSAPPLALTSSIACCAPRFICSPMNAKSPDIGPARPTKIGSVSLICLGAPAAGEAGGLGAAAEGTAGGLGALAGGAAGGLGAPVGGTAAGLGALDGTPGGRFGSPTAAPAHAAAATIDTATNRLMLPALHHHHGHAP